VRIETLAVRLRPRTTTEAADLGVRLCQAAAADVYRAYAVAFVPVVLLASATSELAQWLPALVLWWLKPWLDRTILFVLSRAAFGQATTIADVWAAQREVWWRRLLFTLTIRRFSPWRALTEPVYQLEGEPAWRPSPRIRQLRQRAVGAAFSMTQSFVMCELALSISLLSLLFWFAPPGAVPQLGELFNSEPGEGWKRAMWAAEIAAVFFLEPFYVASGFGMYLNRRAELEAWDLEQEFRRVFAA